MTLLRDGRLEQPNSYGDRPTVTTRAFWQSGEASRVLGGPIAFDGPVRLIQGQQDKDVPWERGLQLFGLFHSADVQLTLVKDGDHRLSAAGRHPPAAAHRRGAADILTVLLAALLQSTAAPAAAAPLAAAPTDPATIRLQHCSTLATGADPAGGRARGDRLAQSERRLPGAPVPGAGLCRRTALAGGRRRVRVGSAYGPRRRTMRGPPASGHRPGNAWIAGGDGARAKAALDAAIARGTLIGQDRGEVYLDRARAFVAIGNMAAARSDLDPRDGGRGGRSAGMAAVGDAGTARQRPDAGAARHRPCRVARVRRSVRPARERQHRRARGPRRRRAHRLGRRRRRTVQRPGGGLRSRGAGAVRHGSGCGRQPLSYVPFVRRANGS